MRKRLKFKNYLNEAKQLKLGQMMPQVVRLQQRFDYVEWREQVNAFWRRALKDNQALLGSDKTLVEEIVEEEDEDDEDESEKSSSCSGSSGSKNNGGGSRRGRRSSEDVGDQDVRMERDDDNSANEQ